MPDNNTPPVRMSALIPWALLTRLGVPEFEVIRRPIVAGDRVYQVGERFSLANVASPSRLRQFYEQRYIGVRSPHTHSPNQKAKVTRPTAALRPLAVDTLSSLTVDIPVGEVESPVRVARAPRPKRVRARASFGSYSPNSPGPGQIVA